MGWMCGKIFVCVFFTECCPLARRVNIEVVFVAFCSILWSCARHTAITPGVCLRFQKNLLGVVVLLSCWLGGAS